jgi:very-short-patch-repair endonuclease
VLHSEPDLDWYLDHVVVPSGRRYRVDMLWRVRRLVLEADGKVKCTRDELWREKRRELRLTRLGYRVERVTWADVLYDWPRYAERLQAVMASAASPTR